MSNRLQVGIDFSSKRAAFALLSPDGEPIVMHRAFANSSPGYTMAKQFLLETLEGCGFGGLDVSGEATSYYWLPFFLQLAADCDLACYDPKLFLLNARWVHWYKKSHPPDHKTDQKDAFYVADRMRTMRRRVNWQPDLDALRLRFYTRLRFHLAQDLTREKCFLHAHLFLKASAYAQNAPFSDAFGHTSRTILSQPELWDSLDNLPREELAELLHELSGHHLPDPETNAAKLQDAMRDSFTLPQVLQEPLQRVLDLGLARLQFLRQQIAQVDRWIACENQNHPGVRCLATIPGFGPVFSSGIVAEIGNLERFLAPSKWDPRRRDYRSRNLRDVEDAVAKVAGLWWPRKDSGDFAAEERRLSRAGNRYLRYYLILAANGLRCHVPEYREFYARKHREASIHKHWRALVLTARRSVGLIVGLLHRHEAWRSQEM